VLVGVSLDLPGRTPADRTPVGVAENRIVLILRFRLSTQHTRPGFGSRDTCAADH
jgi:hypothetical protein